MPLHSNPKCTDWTAVKMAVQTDVVASDRLVATVGDHNDALLITAAPKLLEAAHKVVNNWGNLHHKDLMQLRAAIAEAKGGQ